MLSRAALLLLSIWTLVLPLRHTLLDADWAIGSKHPFDGKAWEDLLGGPTVKYSGGHLAGADVVFFHHEFDTAWRPAFWHNHYSGGGGEL